MLFCKLNQWIDGVVKIGYQKTLSAYMNNVGCMAAWFMNLQFETKYVYFILFSIISDTLSDIEFGIKDKIIQLM